MRFNIDKYNRKAKPKTREDYDKDILPKLIKVPNELKEEILNMNEIFHKYWEAHQHDESSFQEMMEDQNNDGCHYNSMDVISEEEWEAKKTQYPAAYRYIFLKNKNNQSSEDYIFVKMIENGDNFKDASEAAEKIRQKEIENSMWN